MGSARSWGPSHQDIEPPFKRRRSHPIAGLLVGVPLLLTLAEFSRVVIGVGSGNPFAWTIRAVIVLVAGRVLLTLGVALFTRTPRTPVRPAPLEPVAHRPAAHRPVSPAARVREGVLRVGGGAYLGVNEYGEWVTAAPESAVMILGPPRCWRRCSMPRS
jgi:hypothetical protein